MTIVLNEHEWAEKMIDTHSLGAKPFETLCRVAKYYIDKNYSKKETRRLLDTFLLQCDPTASLPKWSETLDYAVTRATKYNAIMVDHIDITKSEMDVIDSLKGTQIRRLAFTLLCLAKYWNCVNPQGDNWVNNKDNEIMRMANINTSIKRQSLMYHTLNQLGLIRFSKKVDNTNVRVCFVQGGEVILRVSDFRNLGYQYLKYHGEPYFECENCGLTVKRRDKGSGRKQKYCPACATEIHIQQCINSVMRGRVSKPKKDLSDRKYIVYMHKFPDGKKYIGMTSVPLSERWRGGHGYRNSPVFDAIKEVGWENVEHYILFEDFDRESAKYTESYYIKTRHTYLPKYGYNVHNTSYSKIDTSTIPKFINIRVDGNGNPI